MSYRVWSLLIVLIIYSCAGKEQFPVLKSEKVNPELVQINEEVSFIEMDSNRCSRNNADIQNEINEFVKIQSEYFEKHELFSLDKFEDVWQRFQSKLDILKLNGKNTIKWLEINGTLLQITGDAKYAVEMEKIIQYGMPVNEKNRKDFHDLVSSFIYTKDVDHVHVNLFLPSEISYEHTLHGKVKIWQEIQYSETDKMTINFGMEKRQYIELFVRIPDWAEGATVTVKNVKYFAPPGGYCQIAKKWKEGDIVEINFPTDKTNADL